MHAGPRNTLVALASALALVTGACGGGDGDAGGAGEAREIEVKMVDIAFEPDTLEVQEGETVRFVFTNEGETRHEAFVGTPEAQAEHGKAMAGKGGHEGHGGGEGKVTVDAGEQGTLTYRFDEAGTFEIGCHEPGHFAAGMKITVDVT